MLRVPRDPRGSPQIGVKASLLPPARGAGGVSTSLFIFVFRHPSVVVRTCLWSVPHVGVRHGAVRGLLRSPLTSSRGDWQHLTSSGGPASVPHVVVRTCLWSVSHVVVRHGAVRGLLRSPLASSRGDWCRSLSREDGCRVAGTHLSSASRRWTLLPLG